MQVNYPSPNHAERPAGTEIAHLVLHYTELDLEASLEILTDARRASRVSSHYVLAEDGTVYCLVPEERVAWHAGQSWWRGRQQLNVTSIGIEIVNLHGDRHDYPTQQIEALIVLCRGILGRHRGIEPRNVVGHSDIAPRRKIDPGLRFPWQTLATAGVGLWPGFPQNAGASHVAGNPILRRSGGGAERSEAEAAGEDDIAEVRAFFSNASFPPPPPPLRGTSGFRPWPKPLTSGTEGDRYRNAANLLHASALPQEEATALPQVEAAELLQRFGYAGPHSYRDAAGGTVEVGAADIVAAFQRRFRSRLVDGVADADTVGRLRDLLSQLDWQP